MRLITKIAIIEIIAGIFGWIWIFASLAAVYYFISAIFFNGEWLKFLIVLTIGIISKGLTRGFIGLKVAFGMRIK